MAEDVLFLAGDRVVIVADGKALDAATGLAVAIICITGVAIWFMKRRARSSFNEHANGSGPRATGARS